MGSGKGNPEHWVAVVKPGRVLFELSGVPSRVATRGACERAIQKLPIKARFVVREEEVCDDEGRSELRELDRRRARRSGWPRPRRSCSTSASSTPPASSTTRAGSAGAHATIARINTVLREREIAAAEAAREGAR